MKQPITLEAEVRTDLALYFVEHHAEVTEGPNAGTTYNTGVGSGSPIVYVHKDGKYIGAVAINLQSLIGEAIKAVEDASSNQRQPGT